MIMARVISREEAKTAITLLRQRQPRSLEDFKAVLGKRDFQVQRLLRTLEAEGVIIRESLSGQEKFWLNESQAVAFLGLDPRQKKRIKHPRGRGQPVDDDGDDPAYC
jgi:predicted transcriptional regulator